MESKYQTMSHSNQSVRPVTRDEIVANLEERHQRFFQEMGINQQTGIPSRFGGSGRRFVCHPYVGSRYGESNRILFVGQDVGKDAGHLQSFEERRRAIEDKPLPDHNAHIAGTFCVALSLLPPEYGWGAIDDSDQTCQSLLRLCPEAWEKYNPLSYIGLTNYYKWTTIGRTRRSGGSDRRFEFPATEGQFLIDEIRCYRPEVVVFQGARFGRLPHLRLVKRLSREFEVHVFNHPSLRDRRRPRDIVKPVWTNRG